MEILICHRHSGARWGLLNNHNWPVSLELDKLHDESTEKLKCKRFFDLTFRINSTSIYSSRLDEIKANFTIFFRKIKNIKISRSPHRLSLVYQTSIKVTLRRNSRARSRQTHKLDDFSIDTTRCVVWCGVSLLHFCCTSHGEMQNRFY